MSTEKQSDPLGLSTPKEQETRDSLEAGDRVRMIAATGRRYLVADTTPVRVADLDAEFIVFDVGHDRSTRHGRSYPPSGQSVAIRVSTIDVVLAEKEAESASDNRRGRLRRPAPAAPASSHWRVCRSSARRL